MIQLQMSAYMRLTVPFDVAGEVELLSLHRIKNRIHTMQVEHDTRRNLVTNLVRANKNYRKELKHNRYCITPDHLTDSVDLTYDFLKDATEVAISSFEGSLQKQIGDVLFSQLDTQVDIMRDWFYINYDDLIYDTNGNIPYAVVQQLRDSFRKWSIEKINPFQESMVDIIEKTMKSKGYDTTKYNDPEESWELLKTLK